MPKSKAAATQNAVPKIKKQKTTFPAACSEGPETNRIGCQVAERRSFRIIYLIDGATRGLKLAPDLLGNYVLVCI
jgi:hypothetical protein